MKAFLRSSRQGNMPEVDGIKGSAKKSDVHACPITRRRPGSRSPRVSLDSRNPEFGIWTKFTGRIRCRFRLTVEAVVVLKASAHLSATTRTPVTRGVLILQLKLVC